MGSTPKVPSIPQMPNQAGAANQAYQNIGNMSGVAQQQAQLGQQFVNNPYSSQVTQGAQAGGQALQNQGYTDISNASIYANTPAYLQPYITQTLNSAYDPQNALHDQEMQRIKDATNVALANSGLQYSAAGAGTLGQNVGDFELQWLNSQLGRQQTGAATAAGLYNTGEQAAGMSSQLGQTGATNVASGAAMPWQASTGMTAAEIQALSQASGLSQQQIADYLQYYGEGTSQANAAVNAAQANINAQNSMYGGLGSGLSLLFGSGGGAGTRGIIPTVSSWI